MQGLTKTFVSPEIVLVQTELPAQDRPVGSLLEPGLCLQEQDPTFKRRSKARVSRSLAISEPAPLGHVSSSVMSAHRSCATASRCSVTSSGPKHAFPRL